MKLCSREGWIALPLVVLAALCFLDQHLNAVDVWRPSSLLVAALSCPLGWLAHWLATVVTEMVAPHHGALAFLFDFVTSAVGTVLNIYLLAACIVYCFRPQHTPAKVREDEFRRLLAEHRKHDA